MQAIYLQFSKTCQIVFVQAGLTDGIVVAFVSSGPTSSSLDPVIDQDQTDLTDHVKVEVVQPLLGEFELETRSEPETSKVRTRAKKSEGFLTYTRVAYFSASERDRPN